MDAEKCLLEIELNGPKIFDDVQVVRTSHPFYGNLTINVTDSVTLNSGCYNTNTDLHGNEITHKACQMPINKGLANDSTNFGVLARKEEVASPRGLEPLSKP